MTVVIGLLLDTGVGQRVDGRRTIMSDQVKKSIVNHVSGHIVLRRRILSITSIVADQPEF